MLRRPVWIKIFATFAMPLLLVFYQNFSTSPRQHSPKKGIGLSNWIEYDRNASNRISPVGARNAAQRLQLMNVSWYYTWTTDPLSAVAPANQGGPHFFPMVYRVNPTVPNRPGWDASKMKNWMFEFDYTFDEQVSRLWRKRPKEGYQYVLLLNEPDNRGGGEHVLHDPADVAEEMNKAAGKMRWLASHGVGAPVMTYPRSNDGLLPWYKKYEKLLTKESRDLIKTSTGRNIIPLHHYPDPFDLSFVKTAADLQNPAIRERAKNSIISSFTALTHDVHREFNARIMLTEFGIADWRAKPDSKDPKHVKENRVPASFVVEVLKDLLPELSERSYITHYAIFANSADWGESLRTNASFVTSQHPARLTSVGLAYAQFRDSKCQKGEYEYQDRIVEWFTEACGPPVQFGWNNKDRNGWYLDQREAQWRRSLSKQEAGIFPNDFKKIGKDKKTCYHNRFSYQGNIVEYKSPACPHDAKEAGWVKRIENGEPVLHKTFVTNRDRVGIMRFYFPKGR